MYFLQSLIVLIMSKFKSINNDRFPEPIGAYSNGLIVPIADKNIVLLTGQIALNSDGSVAYYNDAGAQTEYIFNNIRILLNEVGADICDIVRVVIYVTDMNDFKSVSSIRNRYLEKVKPVSTLVEVSKLSVEGCKVEIEVTAIK